MRSPTLIVTAIASIAMTAVSMSSRALAETPPTADITYEATGPSIGMIGSGVSIFALSYLPAVLVGATSGLGADRSLLVPLAGPWIDLTQRHDCGPVSSCNSETTAKVLIITDGVFQGVGALTVVGGFFTTVYETRTVRTTRLQPTLRIGPGKVGGSGYGLWAVGTF
jgi:hypothetical protein